MADSVSDARITVESLGNGRFRVVRGGSRTPAYAVRGGAETWVFLDGRVFVIGTATDSGTRHSGRHDDGALAAPMPATVVSLHVSEGQTVKAGDPLVTLEAMKMEMAITAPHDGTVRAIRCRVGELVQPGEALVQLEERTPQFPVPDSQSR